MTTIDAGRILERLNDAELSCIETLDYLAEIDSTSTRLMNEAPPAPGRCRIVIADRQTAGRGRRDNRWVSPAGAGLWLSLAYTFDDMPRRLPGLALAIGAGIAEALRGLGAEAWLKWPNDLIACDGKLGGILTELQSQGHRHGTIVVGVGINLELPAAQRERLENERGAKIIDLKDCLDVLPPRDELAALVIRSLIATVRRFAAPGPAAELDAWRRYDWLAGKRVTVERDGRRIAGIAKGIDGDGALLLRSKGRVIRIVSGSVDLSGPAEACA